MCPPLVGRWIGRTGYLVCHCLLVETNDGLLLVDTGFGLKDITDTKRLSRPFRMLVGPALDPEETAISQLTKLGFRREDVRHIAVTHLDPDHAGGLADFPDAKVHVLGVELDAATQPTTFNERTRYRTLQWSHGPKWQIHGSEGGERWFGFEAVRAMESSIADVLLIPLAGHTRGHAAVAVRAREGWLLHAGDAFFYQAKVYAPGVARNRILDVYERMLQIDGRARLGNLERLRALAVEHSNEVRLFCAHDPSGVLKNEL